jgi:hypothetical protein
MVQKPDKSAGPFDIANLLELLNSSEGDDAHDARPTGETSLAGPKLIETSSIPEAMSLPAETVDFSVDPQENSDNRFAAHIVYGLSKLKRT